MRRVLVTGASGYVGGRLVPRLLQENLTVRCLVRTPAKLDRAPWRHDVDVVAGSIEGPLEEAMDGVDVAVYLVHGIGDGENWAAKESRDARHFRLGCEAAGVQRIIFLGGMGTDGTLLSEHLRSRHRVGHELADGPIPVTELRAAVIIGSGSASFEMLRYLVEVLPVMITPKWVKTKCQPIAISDVLEYLVSAITAPTPLEGIYDIGGPDVVSYADMMDIYADEAGLNRRRLFAVPVLTPGLSSHWVGLVTPVPASLARPLVNSLVNEVIVRDESYLIDFGPPQRTLREAIALALGRTHSKQVPTTFTDANLQPFRAYVTDPAWAGGTELTDVRVRTSTASAQVLYNVVSAIGGDKGWYRGEWLWRVRGWLDQLYGGPGLRRGRRDPHDLRPGDHVDFWRVVQANAPHQVHLLAEMRLPGEAWLEWEIAENDGVTTLTQRARFKPRGLVGRLYWYAVVPFHGLIFPGLVNGLVAEADRTAT